MTRERKRMDIKPIAEALTQRKQPDSLMGMPISWKPVDGTAAISIANGADGSIWHVGTDHKIYKWNGSGWDPWPDPGGGTVAMGVGADDRGNPWHIGQDGGIYTWNNNGWELAKRRGITEQLALEKDGTAWFRSGSFVFRSG